MSAFWVSYLLDLLILLALPLALLFLVYYLYTRMRKIDGTKPGAYREKKILKILIWLGCIAITFKVVMLCIYALALL